MGDFIPTAKTGTAVQAAIDAANQAGGGRVVLEPGVYPSGTIYLKSNVELHIPAGSKIQGFDTPDKYDDISDPELVYIAPEGSRIFRLLPLRRRCLQLLKILYRHRFVEVVALHLSAASAL